MPSDPQVNSYLPGSDPGEIGVSASKDGEGQIYGYAGAPPRCFCSQPLPTGASGEEVLALEGRKERAFPGASSSGVSWGTLKVVLHSGKLGPLPRPQMGLKGTPPQLTKSEMSPSWPGKRISPSWCSL